MAKVRSLHRTAAIVGLSLIGLLFVSLLFCSLPLLGLLPQRLSRCFTDAGAVLYDLVNAVR